MEILSETPFDYQGFDRRLFKRSLFRGIRWRDAKSLCCHRYFRIHFKSEIEFMSELRGIGSIYQQIECELYLQIHLYLATYQISMNTVLPVPEGCGGTAFIRFFTKSKKELFDENSIAVYLTDGFAEYPKENQYSLVEGYFWWIDLGKFLMVKSETLN